MAGFRVLGFVSAHLEHREHAIGDRVAAGGIAGAEQHGEEADHLFRHRARVEQSEDPADHDDAVHEIGARHQGRVQDRRHAADDHPAGKGGEHEDVQGDKAGHNDLEVHGDLPLRVQAAFALRRGCDVLAFASMGEHGLGENLVIPVDRDDVVLHHQSEQVVLVLRVQLAGVLAEQRRHVQWRHDRHLADLRRLARLRVLAIAATLGGEIDDHGAGFHPRDLRLADELRRWSTGNGSRGDDEVGLLDMLGQHGGDLALFFRAQFARVTALAARINAGFDEFRAQ